MVIRLVISGYSVLLFAAFVLTRDFGARLVIPGILFSISISFVLRTVAVTNSVTLDILF